MNWLAHLYLSPPDTEFRLGNLLADHVRGPERPRMSPQFLRGVECHQVIDAFAEWNPLVRHSRSLIPTEYRRFSGILVDIFYDHILARNWSHYSSVPLEESTQANYTAFQPHLSGLPEEARITLERIIAHDWLTSYREVSGIEDVLARLTDRIIELWLRPVPPLKFAVSALQSHSAEFEADFTAFMPQLQEAVREWSVATDPNRILPWPPSLTFPDPEP